MTQTVKNLPAVLETWVLSLGGEDSPEEGNGNPPQYSCLEKSHGQRSLVSYIPWGCKDLAMTEQLMPSIVAQLCECIKNH